MSGTAPKKRRVTTSLTLERKDLRIGLVELHSIWLQGKQRDDFARSCNSSWPSSSRMEKPARYEGLILKSLRFLWSP